RSSLWESIVGSAVAPNRKLGERAAKQNLSFWTYKRAVRTCYMSLISIARILGGGRAKLNNSQGKIVHGGCGLLVRTEGPSKQRPTNSKPAVYWPFRSFSNWDSLRISTPRDLALSNLEPGSEPTTT